jgi:tyrosine aminotransferase
MTPQHLKDIVDVAERHKVPIIADEVSHVRQEVEGGTLIKSPLQIYGHMHWSEWPFVPLASIAKSAPVVTLSGLSKRFLLPGMRMTPSCPFSTYADLDFAGWRFGWVALHDPLNVAGAVRNGLHAWGNRIMGPNTLVQKSLKRILSETPDSWYDEVTRKLEVSPV